MVETEITIIVNRKSDIQLIKDIIAKRHFQTPVYLVEYEDSYRLTFSSDYAEWELDNDIVDSFPDYDFTSELGKGKKAIRLQIARYQSPFSTDDWGRPIMDPLDEVKYLIRLSKESKVDFNPTVQVLFENEEKKYHVNIINGIDKESGTKGFLLLNEFRTTERNSDTDFFKDKLHSTPLEAFEEGINKMKDLVNEDFSKYLEDKKKEKRKREKLPRKIIRDFIKASNSSDIQELLKNLDDDISFERTLNWQTEHQINGKEKLKQYLESSEQEFCGRDLKIRSSWNFEGMNVTIGIKYFPKGKNENTLKYGRIHFKIEKGSIISIIEEK